MAFDLHLNWRGPLASCNYDCPYCPFAKHVSSRAELEADEAALERFVAWCASQTHRRLSILFTPWGEALIRPHYHRAMVALASLDHVVAVAAQTNLAWRQGWLDALAELPAPRRASFQLWTTYHPGEVELERFLERCAGLDARGLRYSVGVVGLREHFEAIDALRERLAPGVYLWINAYKSGGPGYYQPGERERLAAIDPLFETNAVRHPSRGQACAAGSTALFVTGEGELRRCHFVDAVLGNLYTDDLDALLSPSSTACPTARCGCFIGYVHLDSLGLRQRFGDGLAGRSLLVRG